MERHPSSFRDPCGSIFVGERGQIYREVGPLYFPQFEHLESSGLFRRLMEGGLLVSHELVEKTPQRILLKPQTLPLITYPCEWCFEALREAALLHLEINQRLLPEGMILKDASGYNVQFLGSRPLFIDTLSFDFYSEGTPWYAFGQFCRHFVAPLLLMKYRAVDFNKALSHFMDGFPLDFTSELLPWITHFSPFIKSHIHLHARAVLKNRGRTQKRRAVSLSRKSLENTLRYTQVFLEDLKLKGSHRDSEWGDYYNFANYPLESLEAKKKIVLDWVRDIRGKNLWDVGGNDGYFSRQLPFSSEGVVVVTDNDPLAINRSFIQAKQEGKNHLFSLLLDTLNPTPAFGFENRERDSFLQRMKGRDLDCIFALALIHHLCLSGGCSFERVASMFSNLARYLIIEFVHREDSWAAKLLDDMRERRPLFDFYNRECFEKTFSQFFVIEKKEALPQGERTLYRMKARNFQ